MGIESKEQNTQVEKTPTSYKGIDKRPLKLSVQVDFPEKLEYMSARLSKDFFYKTFMGALENLCQSGSISNTKGLNNGIADRHRGNITTYS